MRYRGVVNNVVWILTADHRRAICYMHTLGVRETGIPVNPSRRVPIRAIVVSGSNWERQICGYRWNEGDWILADKSDDQVHQKVSLLRVVGAPIHPPVRWI